jgi:putative acetyltransferase
MAASRQFSVMEADRLRDELAAMGMLRDSQEWTTLGTGAMNPETQLRISMRPYLAADAPLLAEVFRASIEELTGEDYGPGQQRAWASLADDETAFAERLQCSLTLVGLFDSAPVAFISLADASRLDMLYVHPGAAGQGIATMLVDAIEKLAAARGISRLSADVSDNAQEFFRRRGFHPRQRNSIPLGREWLANTTMERVLKEEAK